MNTFTPQSSYSYEEIIECGKGNLFGKGNAQLPAPPMLMFDRITHVNKDGGVLGKGEIIVVEADEFDRSFLALKPTISVVTNIELEHTDCYTNLQDLKDTFIKFCNLTFLNEKKNYFRYFFYNIFFYTFFFLF